MEIRLNLPEDITQGLEAKRKDLARAVLESVAPEAYRSGTLTTAQGHANCYQLPIGLSLSETIA